jgi:hypothetical protein
MNETFMLYLFTRLGTLNGVITAGALLLLTATIISIFVICMMCAEDIGGQYPKAFHKVWAAFAVFTLLNIITPTQKDVALILAGSAIMSIARTDEAQRITSKSVRVVEQYLDALLTKEKK